MRTRTASSNLSRSATLAEAACSPGEFVGQLSPIAAPISHLSSGLLLGRGSSLFSERPIYLRSSGLRGFGTVREIPTFRRAYELQQKIGSATPLGQARASESNSPYRGSNPPAPATQSGVRPRSPRNARMGRKSGLFAHSIS